MPIQIFLLLLPFLLPRATAESPTCLTIYQEGGAPAVFKSPNCPRWTLPNNPRRSPPASCQLATHQGRRRSQEDRAVCALDIRIPFLGRREVREVSVSVIAVFDGHNGAEASEMASKVLLEYFLLHVYFLLDEVYSVVLRRNSGRLTFDGGYGGVSQLINLDEVQSWHGSDPKRFEWTLPAIFDDTFPMEILKKSLLRTIHDIDATFSKEASRKDLESGSTATIVLIADDHILTANLGDSKALLCSESVNTVYEGSWSKLNRLRRRRSVASSVNAYRDFKLANADGRTYYAKELTMDHHPDRDDERSRIEAAGGYVVEWAGVLRVNGELAVSRAIGDIPFKNYGVISTPEVTDWYALSSNDSYLVAASDGVFEKMTTQEVCEVLWDEKIRASINSKIIPLTTHSLADSIVKAAFERGSMDNMAIVVLPLGLTCISGTYVGVGCDLKGTSIALPFGQKQVIHKKLDDAIPTSLIQIDYFNQIISKFNRMLVETQYRGLGCFYLSENLNENMDYVFRSPKNYQKDEIHDLYHSLPESLGSYHGGGLLDLYSNQKMCWHFGFHDGDKGHCTSPEVFAKFLGLLDSVPYTDSATNSSESFGYKYPDFRYALRKRFDRGSYGEVWLAFHWNCSQESDSLNEMHMNISHSASWSHLDSCKYNRSMNSSSTTGTDQSYDDMFILKRIMVERGTTAYLSGLREKYFGDTFLNSSKFVGGLKETGLSTTFSTEAPFDPVDCLDLTNSSYTNFRTIGICFEEGLEHIARYVESFESQSKEIWLVFRNEGLSLSKLMYKAEETKLVTGDESNAHARNILVLQPSSWWYWLRTTETGKKEMQKLIWQLLLALKSCHDRNITHRDIKPENMIVCFEDVQTGRCLRKVPNGEKQYQLKMRVIDFGSAIDEFTLKNLYGSGPTRSEQTYEYTPPEALLNANWFQGATSVTMKFDILFNLILNLATYFHLLYSLNSTRFEFLHDRYDMWSVGVVMLELILGSPHVFQISDRTRALMDQHLEGWSDPTKELAYKLRSYMEMCILIPGISPQHHQGGGTKDHDGAPPASWKCSEESFSYQVKSRDPLKLGFPNIWALRLVRQLLVWHPEDRLSVDDALQHPYFQQRP